MRTIINMHAMSSPNAMNTLHEPHCNSDVTEFNTKKPGNKRNIQATIYFYKISS